jgi:PhnB protein
VTSKLNPYISFDGNAREALEFYKEVFGGELEIMTFAAFSPPDAPAANNVMHGSLITTSGYTIMAADPPPGQSVAQGGPMTVSLSGDDGDELRGYWEKLSAGGTVTLKLEKQMWGDEFGMCTDKFGIPWMVNIAGAQA